MSRVLVGAWLALVWVLLWGTPSAANVLSGVLLGALLVVLVPPGERRTGFHPIAIARYLVHFAWALVVATASVTRTVVQPRLQLEEGIVAVPLRAVSPVVVAFVANSITLTPGTMTVDIRPRSYGMDDDASDAFGTAAVSPVLFVHCLVTGDPDQVRADAMRFEELATAAFGSQEDRRAVAGPRPVWPRPAADASDPREAP